MEEKYPFIENLREVMERLGGNEALLVKLLRKFADSYRDTRQALVKSLDDGNFEESHRVVHSIKGVSANLGISAVYRKSIALEQLLKEGKCDARSPETSDFLDELDAVLAQLA